jgi:tetratricopeptide (TPR) repeat protein
MYLRSRPRTSRRHGPTLGRILLWIFAPILIVIGIGVYENRALIAPRVQELVMSAVDDAGQALATSQAPPPTATPDPSNNIRLAEAAWVNGAIQEAVRLYEQIVPARPNDLETHYRYTLGLIMQGRTDDALNAAENTVTANPFASDAWAIHSLAFSRARQFEKAVASGLRALELKQDNARAMAFLAETYMNVNRAERADALLNRAMEANPESFEVYYVRGMYNWGRAFDLAAAQSNLEYAYDLSGQMPYIGVDLAVLYIARQQVDDGLSLLQDILNRNPESTPLLYQIGRYYGRTLGDDSRAIDYFTRCVAADPANTLCYYEMGRAYWDLENFEQARLAFENGINAGSENPFHLYWTGRSQIASLGNCSLAMNYLEPGYRIASTEYARTQDSELGIVIPMYEELMRPCGFTPSAPVVPAAPEVTAEPEPAQGT